MDDNRKSNHIGVELFTIQLIDADRARFLERKIKAIYSHKKSFSIDFNLSNEEISRIFPGKASSPRENVIQNPLIIAAILYKNYNVIPINESMPLGITNNDFVLFCSPHRNL